MLAKVARRQREARKGSRVGMRRSLVNIVRDLKVKNMDLCNLYFFFPPFQNLFVFASLGAVHLLMTINHMTFYKRKLKYEKIPIKMFTIESDTIKIIHCMDRLQENILNWLFLLVSGYCPQFSY